MGLSSLLPLCLLALATCGNTSHLRLSGRTGTTSPSLHRRASALLNDTNNIVYTTNITLGGQQFSVVVDTGSSDLWVNSAVPNAVSQNYSTGIAYGKGTATGNVMSATLDIAGISVANQFFLYAPNGSAAGTTDGMLGLGPSSGSVIRSTGNSSAANPVLDNIFTSNTSVTPLLGVLLQRSGDPGETFPGYLSIGEVLPDYQAVLNQPQHPVTAVPRTSSTLQHWQALLDVAGLIGPNGTTIQIVTQLAGAQTQNATVVFDTGATSSLVPSYVTDALYSNIPGAMLMNDTGSGALWMLDCNALVNATFLFGGVPFPIHPLDLNFDSGSRDSNGNPMCVGAFQPFKPDNSTLFDMLLGMSFLRNLYMTINYGNMVNTVDYTNNTGYIQLLSITNATQAALDFENVRSSSVYKTKSSALSVTLSSSSTSWLIGLMAAISLLHVFA